MATKKSARQNTQLADSPINIGGGGRRIKLLSGKFITVPSVKLKFDHNEFVSDPDDTQNWLSEDKTLMHVILPDNSVVTVTSDTEIVIDYKKGGTNGQIILEGDPLGVRFNGKKLKYRQKKHRGEGFQLKTLTIGYNDPIALHDDDEIEIHTR